MKNRRLLSMLLAVAMTISALPMTMATVSADATNALDDAVATVNGTNEEPTFEAAAYEGNKYLHLTDRNFGGDAGIRIELTGKTVEAGTDVYVGFDVRSNTGATLNVERFQSWYGNKIAGAAIYNTDLAEENKNDEYLKAEAAAGNYLGSYYLGNNNRYFTATYEEGLGLTQYYDGDLDNTPGYLRANSGSEVGYAFVPNSEWTHTELVMKSIVATVTTPTVFLAKWDSNTTPLDIDNLSVFYFVGNDTTTEPVMLANYTFDDGVVTGLSQNSGSLTVVDDVDAYAVPDDGGSVTFEWDNLAAGVYTISGNVRHDSAAKVNDVIADETTLNMVFTSSTDAVQNAEGFTVNSMWKAIPADVSFTQLRDGAATLTISTESGLSFKYNELALVKTGDIDPDILAAADFDELVAEIGNVTLADADAIADARAEYEALSDEAKALVTELETLVAAEKALVALQNPAPIDGAEIVVEDAGNNYLYIKNKEYNAQWEGVKLTVPAYQNGVAVSEYFVEASSRISNLAAEAFNDLSIRFAPLTNCSRSENYPVATLDWQHGQSFGKIIANAGLTESDVVEVVINMQQEDANALCLDNVHVYYMNGEEKVTVALIDFEDGLTSENGVALEAYNRNTYDRDPMAIEVREEQHFHRVADLNTAGAVVLDENIKAGLYTLSGEFRMPYFQNTGYAAGRTYDKGIHEATVTVKNNGIEVGSFTVSPYWAEASVADIKIASADDNLTFSIVSGITDETEYVNGLDILGFTLEKTGDINTDEADAGKVVALIAAIGEVTADSAEAIEAARAAYDDLSDAAKDLVANYGVLVAAEAALKLALIPTPISGAELVVAENEGNKYLSISNVIATKASQGVTIEFPHVAGASKYFVEAKIRAANEAANSKAAAHIKLYSNFTYNTTDNPGMNVSTAWKTMIIAGSIIPKDNAVEGNLMKAAINVHTNASNNFDLDDIRVYYEDGGEQVDVAFINFEDGKLSNKTITVEAWKFRSPPALPDVKVVTEQHYHRVENLNAEGNGTVLVEAEDGVGFYTLSGAFRMPYFQGNADVSATVIVKNNGVKVGEFGISPDWAEAEVPNIKIISDNDEITLTIENSTITADTTLVNAIDVYGLALTQTAPISADEIAAAEVDTLIAAIGEVTLDDEAAIAAARAAYDEISETAQALVENLDVLVAAEKALKLLKIPTPISGAELVVADNEGNKYLYINNINSAKASEGITIAFDHVTDGALTYFVEANVRGANVVAGDKAAVLRLWAGYTYNTTSNGYTYPTAEWQTMVINNSISAKADAVKGNEIKAAINIHSAGPNNLDIDDIFVYYMDGETKVEVAFIDFEDGKLSNDTITVEAWAYTSASSVVRADVATEQHYHRVADLNAEGNGTVLVEAEGEAGFYTLSGAFRMPYFQKGTDVSATVTVKNNGVKVGEFTITPNWTDIIALNAVEIDPATANITFSIESTITDATELANAIDIANLKFIEATDPAIQNAMELIDAIGEVTLDSEAAIKAAEEAFAALNAAQQAEVTNSIYLTEARAIYDALVVDALIEAIGTPVTLASEAAIKAARAAYDALSDAAKTFVNNLPTLEAAEAALEAADTRTEFAPPVAEHTTENEYTAIEGNEIDNATAKDNGTNAAPVAEPGYVGNEYLHITNRVNSGNAGIHFTLNGKTIPAGTDVYVGFDIRSNTGATLNTERIQSWTGGILNGDPIFKTDLAEENRTYSYLQSVSANHIHGTYRLSGEQIIAQRYFTATYEDGLGLLTYYRGRLNNTPGNLAVAGGAEAGYALVPNGEWTHAELVMKNITADVTNACISLGKWNAHTTPIDIDNFSVFYFPENDMSNEAVFLAYWTFEEAIFDEPTTDEYNPINAAGFTVNGKVDLSIVDDVYAYAVSDNGGSVTFTWDNLAEGTYVLTGNVRHDSGALVDGAMTDDTTLNAAFISGSEEAQNAEAIAINSIWTAIPDGVKFVQTADGAATLTISTESGLSFKYNELALIKQEFTTDIGIKVVIDDETVDEDEGVTAKVYAVVGTNVTNLSSFGFTLDYPEALALTALEVSEDLGGEGVANAENGAVAWCYTADKAEGLEISGDVLLATATFTAAVDADTEITVGLTGATYTVAGGEVEGDITVDAAADTVTVINNGTAVEPEPEVYTVTIEAGENGSVDVTEIADVAAGTAITVADNTITIGETVVTATATGEFYVFDAWSVENGATVEDNMTITATFVFDQAAADAAANAAAAAAVDAKIAAIGDVSLESETAIVAAREAYEALNDAAKALVDNLATLEAAEAKLAELKKPVIGGAPRFTSKTLVLDGLINVRSIMVFDDVTVNGVALDDTFGSLPEFKEYVIGNAGMLSYVSKDGIAPTADEFVVGNDKYYNSTEIKDAGIYGGYNEFYGYSVGIAAKEYANDVYIRPYIMVEGECVYGEIQKYGVTTYINNQMPKTTAAAKKVKPLLAAMLNYGAAAQTQFKYQTDKLANSVLQGYVDAGYLDAKYLELEWNDSYLTELVNPSETMTANFVETGTINCSAKTLLLEGMIQVRYTWNVTGSDKDATLGTRFNGCEKKVYVWTADDYEALEAKGKILTKDNASYVIEDIGEFAATAKYGYELQCASEGVKANKYSDTLYAVMCITDAEGVEHCSEVVVYSVENYASRQLSKTTTAASLKNICKWIVVYGEKAAAYFG